MFPFLKEFKASVTTDKDKVGRVFPDTGLPPSPWVHPGLFCGGSPEVTSVMVPGPSQETENVILPVP